MRASLDNMTVVKHHDILLRSRRSLPTHDFFSQHFFGFFFMAENLNDLLTAYHFLNISVDIRKCLVLFNEENADFSRNLSHDLQNNEHNGYGDKRQPNADIQHTEEHGDNSENRRNQLCVPSTVLSSA